MEELQKQYQEAVEAFKREIQPMVEISRKAQEDERPIRRKHMPRIRELENKLLHWEITQDIEESIEHFQLMGETADEKTEWGTKGQELFRDECGKGWILYEDGELQHYFERSGVSPNLAIHKKFFFREAFEIAGRVEVPLEERVLQLKELLDAFKP